MDFSALQFAPIAFQRVLRCPAEQAAGLGVAVAAVRRVGGDMEYFATRRQGTEVGFQALADRACGVGEGH